ncbi:hypothetical protein, partial [Vibrio neptunius]
VLNSICYRIHTEPESIRSHMRDLSTLLNGPDPKQTSKYSWLEAIIRPDPIIFLQVRIRR